jgi:hypothetical protein
MDPRASEPSRHDAMASTLSRWQTTRTAVLGLLAVSGLLVTGAYAMVPAGPGSCGAREAVEPPPPTLPEIEWVDAEADASASTP